MTEADTTSVRPRRRVLANVVLAAASVLAGLLCLEGLLRLMALRSNVRATAALDIYAPDADLAWRLRPDVWRRVTWLGRSIVIRTNGAGHRIPDGEETSPDGPALVFAGDSYVFGNEVEAQETFAWQVGSLLSAPVVNLGVGGYSLDQECRALERYVSRARSPIRLALLAVFIGNDIENGAAPARPTHVDAEGHLVDSDMGTVTRYLIGGSHVFFFFHKACVSVRGRWIQWKDERRVPSYRWIYDRNAWRPEALETHRRSLLRLAGATQAAKVPLMVLLLPERDQVYGRLSDLPNQKVTALLEELEIPALDLLPALRVGALSDPDLYHHATAGHLSPSGHSVVAAAVAAGLRSAPGRDGLHPE